QLRAQNGTILTFNLSSTVELGMDLRVGTDTGGDTATVFIKDPNPGAQGVNILLRNSAGIKVYKDAKLYMDGADGDGSILDGSAEAPSGFVEVKGLFQRRGSGESLIAIPFLVQKDGNLTVDGNTTLRVLSPGTFSTEQASILVQQGGQAVLSGTTPSL